VRALLGSLRCDLIDNDEVPPEWLSRLADAPHHGEVRPAVQRLPALVLDAAADGAAALRAGAAAA
jgi:hypothetical protein